ncbi:MAG: hypothetical protein JXA30_09835 [Deltaproteobacteria bacterium]|nr:hypothetical protein [Deltaproteobacteria bacterium]
MVLAVPDGCRWKRTKRSGRESAKLYVSQRQYTGSVGPEYAGARTKAGFTG